MLDFEEQWKELMEEGAFSESGKITLQSGLSFALSGIFFSGTYDNYEPTKYAGSTYDTKEWFQVSSLSIPEEVTKPWSDLLYAILVLPARGSFKVSEVKGKRGGMLTLFIKESEK